MTGKERVIEVLRREGACEEALAWLEEQDEDVLETAPEHWVWWFISELGHRVLAETLGESYLGAEHYYNGYCDAVCHTAEEYGYRVFLRRFKPEIIAWFDNYDLGDSSDNS